jgi:hypothetical protein
MAPARLPRASRGRDVRRELGTGPVRSRQLPTPRLSVRPLFGLTRVTRIVAPSFSGRSTATTLQRPLLKVSPGCKSRAAPSAPSTGRVPPSNSANRSRPSSRSCARFGERHAMQQLRRGCCEVRPSRRQALLGRGVCRSLVPVTRAQWSLVIRFTRRHSPAVAFASTAARPATTRC